MMLIKTKDKHGRTAYYVATTEGRPVVGAKSRAARLPDYQAATVLEHLITIDPTRFQGAELVQEGA